MSKFSQPSNHPGKQDDRKVARIGLHPRILHGSDFIESSCQPHRAFAMHIAFTVHVPSWQRKWEFRLLVHALASPSCTISRFSIATSLAVALKLGPVHFVAHPFTKFQRTFSSPASSMRTIEPFLRSVLPSMTVFRHFQ